jgi:transcriptional regulator with XRE-family HTH domain
MKNMSQSLVSQISAISPLDGDAIDGSPRPKPRRERKPAREPLDRSLTFFCSNPQCDHGTWSPVEQARHMAREFWEVQQALVRLAPESPEAMKLTGGVILHDLTDDECREAVRLRSLLQRRGEAIPLRLRLIYAESKRRLRTGVLPPLTPSEIGARQRQRTALANADVAGLSDNQVRDARNECERLKRRGEPVPADVYRAALEFDRRCKNGTLGELSESELAERRRRSFAAARAARNSELPPPAERRARRLALGLSVAELAAKLGMSEYPVSQWEKGASPRSATVREAYARLLSSANPAEAAPSVRAARKAAWPPSEIEALRVALGLPKAEFAERIGITPSHLSRLTHGKCAPSAATIAALNAIRRDALEQAC